MKELLSETSPSVPRWEKACCSTCFPAGLGEQIGTARA